MSYDQVIEGGIGGTDQTGRSHSFSQRLHRVVLRRTEGILVHLASRVYSDDLAIQGGVGSQSKKDVVQGLIGETAEQHLLVLLDQSDHQLGDDQGLASARHAHDQVVTVT